MLLGKKTITTIAASSWYRGWLLLTLTVGALAGPQTAQAYHGRIAVLSGISANVWNGECYYPSQNSTIWAPCGTAGTHSGTYTPFDIGNGNPDHWIFFQLDYLPSNIAGGYVKAYQDNTNCASYSDTSPNWNGHKLVVEFQFYNTSGQYVTWAHAVYQHVDTERLPDNTWKTWNNPYSSAPMWGSPDYTLNNLQNGGVLVADIAANGYASGSIGCSTDEHVHQEGNYYSEYNYSRYYNEAVTDRWSDIFYYAQPGITGTY